MYPLYAAVLDTLVQIEKLRASLHFHLQWHNPCVCGTASVSFASAIPHPGLWRPFLAFVWVASWSPSPSSHMSMISMSPSSTACSRRSWYQFIWYHYMISYYDIIPQFLLVTPCYRFLHCPRGNMNWFHMWKKVGQTLEICLVDAVWGIWDAF